MLLIAVLGAVAWLFLPRPPVTTARTGVPASVGAAALPEWAYPPLVPLIVFDRVVTRHVPGSTLALTKAQIEDDFAPPDWYPQEHPPLPDVVAHGRPPAVRACMKCHLSNGAGHPESAMLAGLPVNYMLAQITAFQDGTRNNPRAVSMIAVAKAMNDSEARAAAAYYSALKPVPWIRVVVSDRAPVSFVGQGAMRFATPGGASEPIGHRIIELPEDAERAESRDPHSGFVAHVPTGSIERGAELVSSGGGRTLQCTTCHGADLKGLADIPSIAGRAPQYIYRQLADIKSGRRTDLGAAPMKVVVDQLTDDDLIDIAAYLASRTP
ncbi:MAG TPA: c-type cytochrome [Steroidobacteraceae bacterium]|nr:c-type cytochrome [Steroidobacteraceae bacterium]